MYTFITTGDYVQKIHQSDFIMIFALIIMLVLTGASFCGWICPLGSIQEWVGKLGKKIFKNKYNKVPGLLDKILRFGKYAVLILVIIQTARSVKLLFADFDPYYNLFNIWTDEISITGYISVAVTLILSLLIERPFCRYVCPLGAMNGLFNSFSLFNIKRKTKTCIDCGKCDSSCPAGIVVSNKNSVKSVDCIRCMKCVEACPVNEGGNNTLKTRFKTDLPNKKERKPLPLYIFVIIVIASFLIPIAISQVNGSFITERIKTYDSVSDIRGSSSLIEVIENYGISKGHLYRAMALPETVQVETKLKDLAELTGVPEEEEIISPESIRLLAEIYSGTISDMKEKIVIDAYEFETIVEKYGIGDTDSVKSLISVSEEGEMAYILTGKNPMEYMNEIPETDLDITDGASEEHVPVSEDEIKGKTTLMEIKNMIDDYGKFLETFSIPEDESETNSLKDLKEKYEIEVSEIKEYVAEHKK